MTRGMETPPRPLIGVLSAPQPSPGCLEETSVLELKLCLTRTAFCAELCKFYRRWAFACDSECFKRTGVCPFAVLHQLQRPTLKQWNPTNRQQMPWVALRFLQHGLIRLQQNSALAQWRLLGLDPRRSTLTPSGGTQPRASTSPTGPACNVCGARMPKRSETLQQSGQIPWGGYVARQG